MVLALVTGCSPPGGGGSNPVTCSAGVLDGGVQCQACGLTECAAQSCDDGTIAAANLGAASLDCQYQSSLQPTWTAAMSYCAGLGSGWRLPSKEEARKIAVSPSVCRTPISVTWATWTSTCAEARRAWSVSSNGFAERGPYSYALCVR